MNLSKNSSSIKKGCNKLKAPFNDLKGKIIIFDFNKKRNKTFA